jgi:hypothetical protein
MRITLHVLAFGFSILLLAGCSSTYQRSADKYDRKAKDLAGEVTFESLLAEMTDLEILARMPDLPYSCKQFSSYDRKSTDPAVLTDENWFANDDRGQHLRVEERNGAQEHVMMEVEGPGAIVRIWSANPEKAEIVRVYLDGAELPTIEMALTDMLGGETAPFVSPLSGERGEGWNMYFPIPYARHCKVTASKRDFYYHVNYRTYEVGTRVETFSMALAEKHADLVQHTAAALSAPYEAFKQPDGTPLKSDYAVDVAAGATAHVALSSGPAVLCRFTAKVEAEDIEAALRGCLIEIVFDDQERPSVQAPLGDFFGTAPGLNPFQSLPCGVLEDGMLYSHWAMPYREKAAIRLINHGGAPISVEGTTLVVKRPWEPSNLYFHAKWRAEQDIPTRPRQDWTFLSAQGQGRFVGCMMHVTNPVTGWWGEGDEKIYVDGEAFPSHFGTGTEDYFGYAWCATDLFSHAYHNQPRCSGPGLSGQTCLSRFHILDNIPFTASFKFDMEVWHWSDLKISQSAVAYWYADAGSRDGFETIAPAALTVPEFP